MAMGLILLQTQGNHPLSCVNNRQRIEFGAVPEFSGAKALRTGVWRPDNATYSMPMPFSSPKPSRIDLSQQEMCMISQAISRDFSPRFFGGRRGRQTRFSSQELREISRLIARDYAPGLNDDKQRLVLLALAPRRLHVYWQLAKRRLPKADNAAGQFLESTPPPELMLRIYPPAAEPSSREERTANLPWLDIAVNDWQGHQDVLLPETLPKSGDDKPKSYQAVLGLAAPGLDFKPLVFSNDVAPPRKQEWDNQQPLGLDEFIIPVSIPSSSNGKTASGQGK